MKANIIAATLLALSIGQQSAIALTIDNQIDFPFSNQFREEMKRIEQSSGLDFYIEAKPYNHTSAPKLAGLAASDRTVQRLIQQSKYDPTKTVVITWLQSTENKSKGSFGIQPTASLRTLYTPANISDPNGEVGTTIRGNMPNDPERTISGIVNIFSNALATLTMTRSATILFLKLATVTAFAGGIIWLTRRIIDKRTQKIQDRATAKQLVQAWQDFINDCHNNAFILELCSYAETVDDTLYPDLRNYLAVLQETLTLQHQFFIDEKSLFRDVKVAFETSKSKVNTAIDSLSAKYGEYIKALQNPSEWNTSKIAQLTSKLHLQAQIPLGDRTYSLDRTLDLEIPNLPADLTFDRFQTYQESIAEIVTTVAKEQTKIGYLKAIASKAASFTHSTNKPHWMSLTVSESDRLTFQDLTTLWSSNHSLLVAKLQYIYPEIIAMLEACASSDDDRLEIPAATAQLQEVISRYELEKIQLQAQTLVDRHIKATASKSKSRSNRYSSVSNYSNSSTATSSTSSSDYSSSSGSDYGSSGGGSNYSSGGGSSDYGSSGGGIDY